MPGWATGTGKYKRQVYIRQLRDMKFSADIAALKPVHVSRYAGICGWTLARAHPRSGDASMIAGYPGKSDTFERAIETFSSLYADQTKRDYELLIDAIESCGIEAEKDKRFLSFCSKGEGYPVWEIFSYLHRLWINSRYQDSRIRWKEYFPNTGHPICFNIACSNFSPCAKKF